METILKDETKVLVKPGRGGQLLCAGGQEGFLVAGTTAGQLGAGAAMGPRPINSGRPEF